MEEDKAPEADAFATAVAAEIPRLRRFARVLVKHGDAADEWQDDEQGQQAGHRVLIHR